MDYGQGSGAARGSEERERHRGGEDPRPASQEEWSTGKVGVTVAAELDTFSLAAAFPHYRDNVPVPDPVRSPLGLSAIRICRRSETEGSSTCRARDVRLAHSIIEPSPHISCSVSCFAD